MSVSEDRRGERIRPVERGARVHCRRVGKGSEELILFTVDTCSSTMDLARELAAEERFSDWASVLAGSQSAGRGQLQRRWNSPVGNVYGSLRLPSLGPVWCDLAPLLLAESIYRLLKGLGLSPAIKWPNDLLVAGKKVGGVLVETRSGLVIAGLGLNLISAPPPQRLRNPLAPPAGCLREFGLDLTPREIWVLFVRNIRLRLEEIRAKGDPESFVAGLTSHLAYLGERILLEVHGTALRPVIFQGLDAGGGIKVQTTGGERVFRSGSIYPNVA